MYEGLTYAPSVLAAVLTPRLSYLFVARAPPHALALLACAAAGGGARARARRGDGVAGGAGDDAALRTRRTRPSAAPLQILAGGAVFVFCTWILHAAAIATNLDRRLVVTTVIGLAANVVLNLALIPRWGIRGVGRGHGARRGASPSALLYIQVRRRMREAATASAA